MRLLKNSTKVIAFILLMIILGVPSFAEEEQHEESKSNNVKTYYVSDIKKAMKDYLAAEVDENGIYTIFDDKTGETLSLKFVKIHDPVRVINSNTYFACTDFHVVGNPDKLYDLDFWMSPKNEVLKIYRAKIHKEPRKSLIYGWYKQPRYTFVDDKVVELY